MAYSVNEILDTIRDNASADYQARVPEATKTSLTSIGQVITQDTALANEFCKAIVNRIGMTIVNSKIFSNPLSILKKGGVPLGNEIEEIYTNPAKATTYDYTSTQLLTSAPPDVKALFYRCNRQDKYVVSVTLPMLQRAFINNFEFSTFIDSIISSLYSGDYIDEFILMKNLVATAFTANHLTTVPIFDENATDNDDAVIAKKLAKAIKTYSDLLTFPSSSYNKYHTILGAADKGDAVKTFTPPQDQILILDSTMAANMDIEVLAMAFNMDKAQVQTQTLKVDSFGGQPILGFLCDKSFFRVYDNFRQLKEFENGDTLDVKYFLHHWQTYGYSILANAIAFTYTKKTA